MIEHVFAKKHSERMGENYERVFGALEPVSKMKPNRYELPLTSVRRILGDKFYEMKDVQDDLIKLAIFDNGGFNIEEFKIDVNKCAELISFISCWFQGFLEANDYNEQFTPEFMDRKLAKVAVTSDTGVVYREISMNDIKSLSAFNDAGMIIGMKNIREIAQLTQELQKNDEALKSMEQAGNNQGIQALMTQRNEYINKLGSYQIDVIQIWQNLVKEWSGLEDIKNVFDVSVIFGVTVKSPDNSGRTISQMSLFAYHDAASKTVNILKRKFSLDIVE